LVGSWFYDATTYFSRQLIEILLSLLWVVPPILSVLTLHLSKIKDEDQELNETRPSIDSRSPLTRQSTFSVNDDNEFSEGDENISETNHSFYSRQDTEARYTESDHQYEHPRLNPKDHINYSGSISNIELDLE
jgi:hypothetical protein